MVVEKLHFVRWGILIWATLYNTNWWPVNQQTVDQSVAGTADVLWETAGWIE